MAVITTNLSCELQEAVKVQYLKGNLFSQDVQANKISVAVYDGGEPASISGTVTANIIREDGGTVTATGGTISGNVVSITLPAAAYIVPGLVSIIIKVTASSVTTTIAAVVVNVYQSSTETAIDPGTIIPSVTALVAQIETAVASIPADYSSLWTSLAPAFSSSASYTPGQYVTNGGVLYVCTTAHTGSWNASHFSAVNVGGELSRAFGAFEDISFTQESININNCGYEGGYINSSGGDTSSATYSSSFRTNGFIPVKSGKKVVWWGYLSDGTSLGASAYIAEYDSDKNFISGRRNTDWKKYGSAQTGYEQELSSTTKYIRIALLQGVDDKSTIKIAIYYLENARTSYVPYSQDHVVDYDKIFNSDGDSIDKIIDNKIDDVGLTPVYQYEPITVQGVSGALKPDGTIMETTDVTRYKIPVNKGERYIVTARYGYAFYKAFLILDSNDNVLSYYPLTSSGSAILRNIEVSIEQDGYLVVQDVYNFMPILGSVSHYEINDKLYQKTIYWNGDSVCYGAGGISFADQISLFHAMLETMDAVSGTRLSTRTGYTNSIYERILAMDTTNEYDYIGVEGGYNDYFSSVPIGALMNNYSGTPDTTTVIGAVEGICKFIRTNFSNSKFFFVLGHRPTAVGAYPTEVDTYWDAIISALEKWAVPYVDIRKEGTLMAYNSDWISDYFGTGETMGTHPNTLGYKLFYNDLVESKMKTL